MADLTAMLQAAAGNVGGDYEIERSLRFNSADSAYLSRTPASAGNRTTWTWSGWLKRAKLTTAMELLNAYSDANNQTTIMISATASGNADTIRIYNYVAGSFVAHKVSTLVLRDPSSWYHLLVAWDTGEAAADRIKIYVNNELITSFTTNINAGTENTFVNATNAHFLSSNNGAERYYDGYLADIHFIDGQALTPSSFGETDATTGVWKPKAYAGTYGTNGFHLDFSDNTSTTTLGYDAAGSNDWTLNNFSVTAGAGNDSLVDSPTQYGTDTGAGGEVRGNYCTLNPLYRDSITAATLTNGNLSVSIPNTGSSKATVEVTTGKYYWEFVWTGSQAMFVGVSDATGVGRFASSIVYAYTGDKYINGTNTAYGNTYTVGDVIGIALDMDGATVTFYKNNSSQGSIALSGASISNAVPIVCGGGGLTVTGDINFGQRPFAYTAPSGFKALCTTNLPDPTVLQGDDYFNTVLYTGTGSSLGVTGVGFQPDFVWIKERSGAADHALYDAVRGVQQQLESNTTTDETTESTGLTAFGSDGFTVGSLAQVNTSTDTYVAWNWKESTVSKFDIVTYTGNGTARTISHNLGVVPNMIIVKARTTASTDQGWPVYHSANTANPETDYLLLNSTAATADLDTVWNDTAPTSSVFSVGTNALVNANNDTYVAYLFANVAGYSAFGSYTGNGSTDGPFVYTGFRPAWVIAKRSDAINSWNIIDATRSPINQANDYLSANTANAENASGALGFFDFLSNGFKVRTDGAYINASGGTWIYAAFAENPFKNSLAR